MDELADSVKKTLIQRMNTPLFGFIVLSWFSFNWDGFLIVLMGDGELQGRIAKVKAENFTLLYSLFYPVACGFFLAIIFPYANSAVSFLQRHSQKLIHKNDIERIKAESEVKEKIAELNAKDDSIYNYNISLWKQKTAKKALETAAIETDIVELREESETLRQKISDDDSKSKIAETLLDGLRVNIESKEKELAELKRNVGKVSKKWSEYYSNKTNFDSVVRIFKSLESSVYDETFKAGFEQYGEDHTVNSTLLEQTSREEALKILEHIHLSCRSASKQMNNALGLDEE